MSDLSAYLAGEIVDWFSQDGPMPAPPGTVYVTLFDDAGNEVDGDVQNGRVGLSTSDPAEWDRTNTAFENGVAVDFGEALSDIDNITDVGLYDSETGGNELARYELENAPVSVSEQTVVTFAEGELSFDVIDRTQ